MKLKLKHVAALAFLGLALLSGAAPARAHKQSMKLSLSTPPDSTSPLRITKTATLNILQYAGGTIQMGLREVKDASGSRANATGNTLRFELRVNGVPRSVALPFDIVKGKTKYKGFLSEPRDLFKGDLIELVSVGLWDAQDRRFGVLGALPGAQLPILRSGVVFVVDTTSAIRFSRGGDTLVRLRDDGYMNSGFDKLLDSAGAKIDAPGVRVEIELSVNGGAPEVRSYDYDITRGRSREGGRPHTYLGLDISDEVEVRRIDIFDGEGNRFATLGVKIVSPRE